ncbi:MADS-box transcription factor 22-like [Carex rostrata]
MVRGKVPLKRNEDPAAMQVIFSKRRNELLKKAKELELCGAQVGVIVVSATSELMCYGNPGIDEIIERRNTHSDIIQFLEKAPLDLNVEEEIEGEELEKKFLSEEEATSLSILERLNLLEERTQNLLNCVKEQIQLKEKTIVEVL